MRAVATPPPTRATTEVTMDDLSPNDYAYKALQTTIRPPGRGREGVRHER